VFEEESILNKLKLENGEEEVGGGEGDRGSEECLVVVS
jgi:hypothetical protein